MNLADYLALQNSEKVLLVEIDGGLSKAHRLSDRPYVPEPLDVGGQIPYKAVLSKDGIPRLTRRIQDIWGGGTVRSWGTIDLLQETIDGQSCDTATGIRGKTVKVKLTGPRAIVPYEQAVTILTGVVGRRSGDPDVGITLQVNDSKSVFAETPVPNLTYDILNTADEPNLPQSSHGFTKPACYGYCSNVFPVLTNKATREYQVHGYGPINDIPKVYDGGVSRAFTFDAADKAAGKFRLSSDPSRDGLLTADVEGHVENGVFLTTTEQIIDHLAQTYGELTSSQIDISGLPAGDIGIYLKSATTLDQVISMLTKHCVARWDFSRNGNLTVRVIQVPAGGGTIISKRNQLGNVTWEELEELYFAIPVLWQKNWTPQEVVDGVTDLDDRQYKRTDGYQARVEDLATLITYPFAKEAPRLDTLFQLQTDAEEVGQRTLNLFKVPRKETKCTVPVSATLRELGDEITLTDAGAANGNYIVIGVTDAWDLETPTTGLELFG